MMFVMTLCACRLYSGTIMRREDALEEVEAVEVEE
jgi:hypothetical protein